MNNCTTPHHPGKDHKESKHTSPPKIILFQEFKAFDGWTFVKIRVRWKWGPIILGSEANIFSKEKLV